MKKVGARRGAALVLAALLCLALAGCGGGGAGVNQYTVNIYVQGHLDTYYKGTVSPDFLEMMEWTEEDIQTKYQDGLAAEFEYMAYVFEIETGAISGEVYQRGVDLMGQVYAYASYTVKEPVRNSEGNYMVEVEVQPVDVFAQVYDSQELMDFAVDFNDRYAGTDWENMTDEAYTFYEDDWANGVLDLCEAALSNAGYLEARSVVVQVKQDSEGVYGLGQDDFDSVDALILAYTTE